MELSVEKYLQRINYTGDTKPTKENLVVLQRCHLMSVPPWRWRNFMTRLSCATGAATALR